MNLHEYFRGHQRFLRNRPRNRVPHQAGALSGAEQRVAGSEDWYKSPAESPKTGPWASLLEVLSQWGPEGRWGRLRNPRFPGNTPHTVRFENPLPWLKDLSGQKHLVCSRFGPIPFLFEIGTRGRLGGLAVKLLPGVLGSSPTSGSLHGACFFLCLCLCLSLSVSVSHE
ncbi:hypothetical protein VULLAG_LOCUS15774 [Vulpes lagopus]